MIKPWKHSFVGTTETKCCSFACAGRKVWGMFCNMRPSCVNREQHNPANKYYYFVVRRQRLRALKCSCLPSRRTLHYYCTANSLPLVCATWLLKCTCLAVILFLLKNLFNFVSIFRNNKSPLSWHTEFRLNSKYVLWSKYRLEC